MISDQDQDMDAEVTALEGKLSKARDVHKPEQIAQCGRLISHTLTE